MSIRGALERSGGASGGQAQSAAGTEEGASAGKRVRSLPVRSPCMIARMMMMMMMMLQSTVHSSSARRCG